MGVRVLALIENNIGTKLLLATRLKTLGYKITILSTPVAFRKQVEADAFDWILLDEAALPPVRRRFLEHLRRHRKEARLVWCGKRPRWTSVPIAATFDKPLRYDDIERFFLRWVSPDLRGAGHPEEALPWRPVGKPKGPSHSVQEGQESPGDASGTDGTPEGDETR